MSDDLQKRSRRIAKRFRELAWALHISIEREDLDEAASALEDQAAEITRLRQEKKIMDWQPIETAPKDKTPILGYNDQSEKMAVVHWRFDAWRLVVCGDWAETDEFEFNQWSPISPPKTTPKDRDAGLQSSIA